MDGELSADFNALWAEADQIWEEAQNKPEFHAYVSADYRLVLQSLSRLRGRALTFLEWGSGLGVATMMASRLGFEAYGIETETRLVDRARRLARRFAPEAQFAAGSFIPREFQWAPEQGDAAERTALDCEPAYQDFDLELRDFDLVYAYPWPEEHALYHNIMRQCGGGNSLLLTYDAREGMALGRPRRH